MKATLSLTHNCNLACRYCYAGKKERKDMAPETAFKAVDVALAESKNGHAVHINFFGGEPFLCLDLMKAVAAYAKRRADQLGRAVLFAVTTNGTLLGVPALEFLAQNEIDLCISIDGPPEIHNRHRVYADGKGSFECVARNLEKALTMLPSVQVNAVYGPNSVKNLGETVDLFIALGVPTIHLNMDIMTKWHTAAIEALEPSMAHVADRYISCYQRGEELAINIIDGKAILLMKGGYAPQDCCGMGETEIGIAPSGNIYACERLIGEDDDPRFVLGNVHTGVDLKKRCQIVAIRGNVNPECPQCIHQPYCMNWCGCSNFHMTGFSNQTSAAFCAGERAAIGAAKRVFTTLASNDLYVDHLMHYVQKDRCAITHKEREA